MDYGDKQVQVELAYSRPSQYFTPGVILLLVLMVVGLVLSYYAHEWTDAWLVLYPTDVLHGHVWKLVTYSFVNCPLPMVLNGLVVVLCGSAIEREWRTRSFLLLWLVVGGVCGVVWTLVSLIISLFGGSEYAGVGSASCVYGIFGAFGLVFRRQRVLSFFFLFEAQYIVLILIGIGLIFAIPQPMTLIWVGGAGVAYLYIKLIWRIRSGWSRKRPKEAGRFAEID